MPYWDPPRPGAGSRGSPTPAPTAAGRLNRLRAAALAAAAALFLSNWSVGAPARVTTPGEEPQRAERAVVQFVTDLNPSLSAQEMQRIARAVLRYSTKYELDPALVLGVLKEESSARPWARSPKGALGLMQVMPHMLKPLEIAGNHTTIESNIEAGCLILATNIRRLGEEGGISAYFWGSEIRGVSYLNRVSAAREQVRRRLES